MEGVVAYGVAFLNHPLNQIRTGLKIIAYQEEGCRRLVLFQSIQNGGSVAVFKACIEG